MSNLETLKSEIDALTGTPLAKALPNDEPVDLLKSHIESYTRKDGAVVNAHDDNRVKKVDFHANAHAAHKEAAAKATNEYAKPFNPSIKQESDAHDKAFKDMHAHGHAAGAHEIALAHAKAGTKESDFYSKQADSASKSAGEVAQSKAAEKKPSAVPPIHAHTDKIRALATERKGNKTNDHEQMNAVADHLDKGDHASAASTLKNMDTEPRDAVLDHVHPAHREKLGFKNNDEAKNTAKFEKDHPAPEKKVVLKKPKAKPEGKESAKPAGEASPQGDANEKGWDKLHDDENPKHALSGFSSKNLSKVAKGDADLNDYAHKELAGRGMDSDGNWIGFDKAAEHHKEAIGKIASHKAPGAFNGYKNNEEEDGRDTLGMLHTKVLSAAAKGHLDLNKRAKDTLAGRGHDSNGDWVGFDKAKEHHFPKGEKAEDKPLAKSEDAADLLKSHINAYTKKNGVVVGAHDDNRSKKPAFMMKKPTDKHYTFHDHESGEELKDYQGMARDDHSGQTSYFHTKIEPNGERSFTSANGEVGSEVVLSAGEAKGQKAVVLKTNVNRGAESGLVQLKIVSTGKVLTVPPFYFGKS
jgi:hypothetical protein